MAARYFRFMVTFENGSVREIQVIEANERAAKNRLLKTNSRVKKINGCAELSRSDYLEYCQQDLNGIQQLSNKLFYR